MPTPLLRRDIRTVVAWLAALPLLASGAAGLGDRREQLPEGNGGIAAHYPGDEGIDRAPAVLFADDFARCSSIADLRPKWDVLINETNLGITDEPGGARGRTKSLSLTIPKRETPLDTGVAKNLTTTQNILFLRWYEKFEGGWSVPGGSVHNGASISSKYMDHGRATPGVRADGHNKFLVNFENENSTGDPPGFMNVYVYWPEQADRWGDHFYPSGTVLPTSEKRSGEATFGKQFEARPDFSPLVDRWYCYEYMVKANTPGSRDGRIALWVDGKLIADFPNLRLRDVADLEIDRIGFDVYIANNTKRTNRKWINGVVAATAYIGPTADSP
jgi:ADP-ribose pyrophosphatase YjhB (NUDIX family)